MGRPLILGGRPTLQYSAAATSVAIDGNSIGIGAYATAGPGWANSLLAPLAPILGHFTVANSAISGQTFLTMQSNISDVNAAWQAGKRNVLVLIEIVNTIRVNGYTAAQVGTAAASYIASVKAVNPWDVVLVTAAPIRIDPLVGGDTEAAMNQRITEANDYFRANYRTLGASAVADIRQAGSPFNFDYTNPANFSSAVYAKLDGSDGGGVIAIHYSNASFIYMAGVIADALKRIPK